MIIAIDGPSGAGKSTLGKRLATELNLLYLDTGAMYRAAAFAVLQEQVNIYDVAEISRIIDEIEIDLSGAPSDLRVLLNNRDVSEAIRTPEVSQAASIISTIPAVRRILVDRQRQLGIQSPRGCVLDGRDIGTVVFPKADLKFFLTATPESRATRRFAELQSKNVVTTLPETLDDINERDERDANRHDSPLKQAADAIAIDSTNLTLEEVAAELFHFVREKQKRNSTSGS